MYLQGYVEERFTIQIQIYVRINVLVYTEAYMHACFLDIQNSVMYWSPHSGGQVFGDFSKSHI